MAGPTNITAAGRRRRAVLGVVMVAVAITVIVAVRAAGLPPAWAVLAWMPFWVAALCLQQARTST